VLSTMALLKGAFLISLNQSKMKTTIIVLLLALSACSKKEDAKPKSLAPAAWAGNLYCTYFYNPATNDTFCHVVLNRKQFDSLNFPYGLHLWCNTANGTEYVGVEINDPNECK